MIESKILNKDNKALAQHMLNQDKQNQRGNRIVIMNKKTIYFYIVKTKR